MTLYLVALNEYNDDFHQNDTLNSIVLTSDWTYYVEDFSQFDSITRYIDLNRTDIMNDAFELNLAESPSKDIGDYKFGVIFVLSNGEIFVKESDKVKLTN